MEEHQLPLMISFVYSIPETQDYPTKKKYNVTLSRPFKVAVESFGN